MGYPREDLRFLHPYAFILKGGEKIKHNLLDYQLMMLQITNQETIKSPPKPTCVDRIHHKMMNLTQDSPFASKAKM